MPTMAGTSSVLSSPVYSSAPLDTACAKRLFGVGHAPRHRRGAGAVGRDEAVGKGAFLGVEDVVDVALAPDRDGLGAVAGDRLIAHAGEQRFQRFGIGMGELDEFETVGAGGVVFRNFWRAAHRAGTGPSCLSSRTLARFI
jgi:hypothetical protein